MQTVAETPTFSRQADKLFSEDEKRELIDFLAEHPLAGMKFRARTASGSYASQPSDGASEAVRG